MHQVCAEHTLYSCGTEEEYFWLHKIQALVQYSHHFRDKMYHEHFHYNSVLSHCTKHRRMLPKPLEVHLFVLN